MNRKESNPFNFFSMNPLTILWQYTHTFLSTNSKLDSLPTSLSQEVAQKELKAQTPSI
jgi:hypothetical protein